MNKVEDRAELEMAYNLANDAITEARHVLESAKNDVLKFDAENPEVMETAKKEANQRKSEAGEAARLEREAADSEDGAE